MYLVKVMTRIKNDSDYQAGMVDGVKPMDDAEARQIIDNVKIILGLAPGAVKQTQAANTEPAPVRKPVSKKKVIHKCEANGQVVYSDSPCT